MRLFTMEELEAARTPKTFGELAGQREKNVLLYIKSHPSATEGELVGYFKSPQDFTFHNNAFSEQSIRIAIQDLNYYGFIHMTVHGGYKITKSGLNFLRSKK